ncbi:hypothetical protein ACHQM5_009986 [Ranunculus cassubicifolius]
MRDLVLIVGSSTTFLPPSRDSSTGKYTASKNIHITPPAKLSSRSTTSSPRPSQKSRHQNVIQNQNQNYYGELASKLAGDGKFEDFIMIAETVLASSKGDPALFVSSLNTKLVSLGVSNLISQGKFPYVFQIFTRIHKLGILPCTLFHHNGKSVFHLECRRLLKARNLKDLLHFMEKLAGFSFSIKELVKPSEIVKLCVEESDPDMAVRYAEMLPHAPAMFSSIILEFGKKGDLTSAVSAYAASKCKSDVPNMYICRTMIDVCGLCGDPLKSRYVYEDLLAENVIPNTYVFNSLMNVNAHDLSYALHVYRHMKSSGVAPDLASYNILLKACCRAERVDLAQDIYEEVTHIALMGRLKLDVITYSTLIKVFADAKMWQMALKVKEDMLSAGVTPNVVTWSSLISACANARLLDQAMQVFDEMLLADCKPNVQCYNSLLHACVEACQYDKAFRIFRSWRGSSFHTRKCNANGQIEVVMKISKEIDTMNSQGANPSCYHLSAGKVGPFTPTIATYNILMKACGTDYYRAKTLMDEMKIDGLSPNHISWSILIDICGSTGNAEGAVQALKAMNDKGVKPDVIAYTTAIQACVRNKSLKLAFSLFEEMKRSRVKPNLVTYHTLLRARTRYGSLHEVQQCLAIYQDMRRSGYSPSDCYLKELIEEWCEGVITDNTKLLPDCWQGKSEAQNMLLEKIATRLQRDTLQSFAVDLRGLSKVEARIVVLAVLRMIKENYGLGDGVKDDIIIILGVWKDVDKFEVQDAVVKLLQNELGLTVLPPRTEFVQDVRQTSAPTRRPAILRRLKVTRKSLYEWLKKKVITRRRTR